jgi:hypothetical protein
MKKLQVLLLVGTLLGAAPAFSQIQTTIASLRTITASTTTPYFITDPGREGLFYYDSKDLTSADNGGTVIVNGTKRFKRMYSGALDVRWFGMKGDWNGSAGTDNTAAFLAALAAAGKNQVVVVPQGGYYVKGSIALPLTQTKKVYVEVYGDIYFGKGSGFILEGQNQSLKCYGLLAGGNSGATTEATYAAYTGTGVLIKNAMQADVEVNEVKDFKYGIHVTGDNAGTPNGCQYNRIRFNAIHHNYVQIRLSIAGVATPGNWNNSNYFYGGQLGRGVSGSYGKGGWYGVVMLKEAGSNATDPLNGNMFTDVGFEGLEKAIVMSDARYNSFTGGRFELKAIREGINLDPNTAICNKFVGAFAMIENIFVAGRLGSNTIISGSPIWSGQPNQVFMGSEASNSITPNKLLVTTNKYQYTNFEVAKTHDLISQTGEYPTVEAMTYRINGVKRAVPFKSTFFYVKTSTAGTPLALPANIGLVRVEANQAKVLKIDAGDLVKNGHEFLVEYLTPQFPLSFIRSDNSAQVIAATQFPSAGTYRCLWVDGVYKVSKIGEEYKTQSWTGSAYTVPADIKAVFMNASVATATVTLPTASLWPGREVTIKNMQTAKNVQVVGVSASDENLIQGRGAMTVKSDGTSWNIINFYKRNLSY